jgi:hypothetical protein
MSQTGDAGDRNGPGLPPPAAASTPGQRVDYLVPLALIVLGLVVLASAWPLRSRRS